MPAGRHILSHTSGKYFDTPLGYGLIAYLILWQYQTIEAAALQVIFIGLAALTVPHMALVDGLWHPVNQAQKIMSYNHG